MTTVAKATSRRPTAAVAGLVLFAGIFAAALVWAKWQPYGEKLGLLWDVRSWSGTSIVDQAGSAGSAPSWHGGWSFTTTYFSSVWMALAAALVIAAAADALLPSRYFRTLLARRGRTTGAMMGGLLAAPCMMCTCCTAPITKTMHRRGASTAATLAFWLGNPALNPAVLVFLALVAPWQWTLTRALAGIVLVFGVTVLVARLADARRHPAADTPSALDVTNADQVPLRSAPARFVRSLLRLSVILVPEYLVVVFAVGAFRGWLFPLGTDAARWGLLAVLVATAAGIVMVVPTGGEIPILLGLAAAGLGAAPLGALLITLPAISLPSMLMVAPALGWRVTLAAAGGVGLAGLGAAALLAAIS